MSAPLPPDQRAGLLQATDKPMYFAPGTFKLAAMSLATFGLYTMYWFWRNWQAIQRESGQDLWPWARAVFCPLWCFSCFAQLADLVRGRRRELAFPVALLGIVFLVLNLVGRLDNAASLLAFLSFVPLLPVNALLRQYHRDERIDSTRLDRLTIWHVLILLAGGMLLLMLLAVIILGEVSINLPQGTLTWIDDLGS
ncbi:MULTISPECIES: hypothetical protein [unclassified Stenotrophomonas]|uniref:hypothetical protein n=1 Tax=unclassified Stenotrophomonas TaxID=196198 RepID=UPI002118F14B|nr:MULTISPECIES: hypothetical protein [unclassified Stenotrophomonas]